MLVSIQARDNILILKGDLSHHWERLLSLSGGVKGHNRITLPVSGHLIVVLRLKILFLPSVTCVKLNSVISSHASVPELCD